MWIDFGEVNVFAVWQKGHGTFYVQVNKASSLACESLAKPLFVLRQAKTLGEVQDSLRELGYELPCWALTELSEQRDGACDGPNSLLRSERRSLRARL